MDPRAIQKAFARARIAAAAIKRMQAAETPEALADDWVVFLVAWKAIYTILEQGAKSSPQSRQWFGAVKAQRKADPMLDYLFHARNDDEHGLDQSTALQVQIMVPVTGGKKFKVSILGEPGNQYVEATDEDGNLQPVQISQPFMGLMSVKLRDAAITVHPPHDWEGLLMSQTSVAQIAPLALGRSIELLRQASRLPKP